MRIHPVAAEVAKEIVENIEGRAADNGISLIWLGSMVAAAGDGDHVDIGTLFGASAIEAALVKKRLGLKGKVYCIDPYEPRDNIATNLPDNMPKEGDPETLMRNAEKFGVELTLIQKRSYPWPDELKDAVFATAYIDGDHLGDTPWNDFQNVQSRTTHYIGFDNFEETYGDVIRAVQKAVDTGDWFYYFKNGVFVALRRTYPPRSPVTPVNAL